MTLYISLAVLAALIIGAVFIYNQLIAKRQMVENGWSDIDVQLKRRADLIPSLVAVVKGYASHEKGLLEGLVEKRSEALAAKDQVSLRGEKESQVSQALFQVTAIAEGYPDLKANEQFLKLQSELSKTEDEISFARRFFNGAVREYNIAIASFPAVLMAGPLSFTEREFFEIEQSDRALPSVSMES